MFNLIGWKAFGYLAESVIDRICDPVLPVPGSVVYCDLLLGCMEHSGIYVGENTIVHLTGKGDIWACSPNTFLKGTTGTKIQVSCWGTDAVGSADVAARAQSMVYKKRNYQIFGDNCHRFTVGCLTGNFENDNLTLAGVINESRAKLMSDNFRLWDR